MRVLVHFLFSLAGRLGFPVIFNQSLTQMVSPEETREPFSFLHLIPQEAAAHNESLRRNPSGN